ncbi:equilibrative nucleoside transporter 3-like isoform X1 [Rhynchophorus ferrugineus]|uniref:equilibrative nucleoside transporter 3-like isoform X1 n=1 Tax=Rhynchophorus ferrugineus TaxID=354439 RepID=UPI003FCD5F75
MEAESAIEIETISKVILTEKIPEPQKVPKDKYSLCLVMFYLLGIVHILPISFPVAANDFWKHKFRNTTDPDSTTTLQSYFASARSVVNTIPWVVIGILNILYGHKLKLMPRIIITYVIELVIFIIMTAFVEINTDSYQTSFFIIVLALSGVLTKFNTLFDIKATDPPKTNLEAIQKNIESYSAANVINILSSTLLYPKFPHNYMKICLMGQGSSGILSVILNIISVALFDDVDNAALMYFLCGTFVIAATLILMLVASRGEFFRYCLDSFPEDVKKKTTSRDEIKFAAKKIWANVFLVFFYMTAIGLTHPAITSLVISESDKNGAWSKKFFSPVATFLWSDLVMLTGRFVSAYLPIRIPEWVLCIYAIVNTVLFVPAIWFCNTTSRSHLPILFPHDWQYVVLMGFFMFGNGYLFNIAITSIPKKTTKEESEVAFNIFNLFVGLVQTISSPLGVLVVKLL